MYLLSIYRKIIKKIINRCFVNMENSATDCMDNNDSCNSNTDCGCSRSEIIVDKNYGNKRYWR